MLIDWFTVSAQIVNFLILVWLLHRYLYRPILSAIDARECEIAAQLHSAREARQQAQGERDALSRQRESLEHRRLALVSAAENEAKEEAQRLLAMAESERAEARAESRRQLQFEIAACREELINLLKSEVIASTRKLLKDLASASLEEKAAALFADRLRDLPSVPSLNGNGKAELRCPYPLTPIQQRQIEQTVQDKFGTSSPLKVEVDPSLLIGFDLKVGDHRLEWTVDSYLDSFTKRLQSLTSLK